MGRRLDKGMRMRGLFMMTAVLTLAAVSAAQNVVVLQESGFPSADAGAASVDRLEAAFGGAKFAAADQLGVALTSTDARLLVLPYGSAFPEQSWDAIKQFLDRGGNLLVLGGRPFTRTAYHDAGGWHLRDYSARFTRPLMIDQYQETPGSAGMHFERNADLPLDVPEFAWKRGFSPVFRLSAVDLYHRGGSAGSIDARLDTIAWGVKDGRKLSAPVIQIDHYRNGFDGGRWIFVNAEVGSEFFENTVLIQTLAQRALQGAEEFTVRPVLPLYLAGETPQVEVRWHPAMPPSQKASLEIRTNVEGEPAKGAATTVDLSGDATVSLAPIAENGLHIVEARLMQGERVRAIYHSAFWIRDEEYLRSGPRLGVNRDYFEVDGKPLAVVGTTYMSSEAQRLYFEHPNVYVWNQDLGQIQDAGLNMIRTGWWTGWDKFCDENGQPYERTLRTFEAYLMTARKYRLPVQFEFFAFLPEVLGGKNAYLDPEAMRRQKTLISAVVARFHDVPFLAWDLINEPSFSEHVWTHLPNGDAYEVAAWNAWLTARYPDRRKLAALWNVPEDTIAGTISLPTEGEFQPRGMYTGTNSLRVNDYLLFVQETFAKWAAEMRDTIHRAGSQQLVTVGQDEGGIQDRPSPAFWGESVDFTTNHSWWLNDSLLWDSLAAKQPGKPLLIQETGLQRELNLDETARRTTDSEAALLEKKMATAFIQSSGSIEWLWNTNSYMTESNETPIGAVRTDSTEKPEATLMRAFAKFAPEMAPYLVYPKVPETAIVTSQAAQYSVMGDFQLQAQQRAVRALAYDDHLTCAIVAENQIDKLGTPKLVILPSPQALGEKAWRALMKYVEGGGNLLITGPVERNGHWQVTSRVSELGVIASVEPLVAHNAAISVAGKTIALEFGQQAQNWLETLRFEDGTSFKEALHGNGKIFWSAYPVELAEGSRPASDLYSYVAAKTGVAPMFTQISPLRSGVLAFPTALADSVMYVFVSDVADDSAIDIRDSATGVEIRFALRAQHAAIAVVGKKERKIVAKYGF